jgi:hypothetical protein
LLLLCLPRLAAAQAVLTLTPQDCVYRQGDDLAWASPTLDDSAWQPYSHWHADLSHPRLWIRCHANLSGLLSVSQPALQVRLYGPYELFLDGQRFAGSGNLATGDFSLNAIRSYPLVAAQIAQAPQLIAMRVFDRSTLYYPGPIGGIIRLPFRLRRQLIFPPGAARIRGPFGRPHPSHYNHLLLDHWHPQLSIVRSVRLRSFSQVCPAACLVCALSSRASLERVCGRYIF